MHPEAIWPGLIGGLAIGLFSLLQLLVTGRALGCSTGYGNVCGLVSRTPYFHQGPYIDTFNWRFWFTLGLPLGGLAAAVLHGDGFAATFSLGAMYESVMPSNELAKAAVLFVSGGLIGFGARMAGGCTSGHSIVGLALRAPSSLLASVGFFVGGTVAVQALFRLTAAS
jgi:uncharacterized membrane protein YedE/YeeE